MSSEWDFESAKRAINGLVHQAQNLHSFRRNSAEHTRCRHHVLSFLQDVFGQDSHYYRAFVQYRWGNERILIDNDEFEPNVPLDRLIDRKCQERCWQDIQSASGLLQAAADELARKGIAEVYAGKNTPRESSELIRVLALIERKLRKAVRVTPDREKLVQGAIETLLDVSDVPYSREKIHIEYSSKTYIPDFVCDRIDLAIDVKLCHRDDREKQIIAEINDDIAAYRTKYGNALFVVYDVGLIRDVELFAAAFEQHEGVLVRVIKH